MRKMIALGIFLVMLALTACGQPVVGAETPQVDEPVQIPNPWRDIAEEEAAALCPGSLRAPKGAENVQWSVMEAAGEAALIQLCFDLNGYSYTAREQVTGDKTSDISGTYYTWTAQTDMVLRNWEESAKTGTYYRFIGEDEWVDLCVWYDAERGISYSLSVTAKDLDGFDLQAIAEALAAERGRQDGERFEAVIVLEGMEETVLYEHIRNDRLGFELDYDYEHFERHSEADRERLISIWDDPQAPTNYLDVTSSTEDAESVAASVRAELSGEYDLLESTRELEGSGSCIRIEASELKGTGMMADQIQVVYIIPSLDGCCVATAHYASEAAEGFGRRFFYMLNSLAMID